jgi:hypothetical protein
LAEKGNHLKPEVIFFGIDQYFHWSSRLYSVENYQSKCVICVKRSVQNPVESKRMIIEYIKIVNIFFY